MKNTTDNLRAVDLPRLVRRLGVHRRRLRYWANLPGVFGPTGKALRKREEMYELARDDAHNITQQIHAITGTPPTVVDPLRTFQCRYNNVSALPVLIYPPNASHQATASE